MRVNIDSRQIRQVGTLSAMPSVERISISTNGKAIYFTTGSFESDIWLAEFDRSK